MFLFAALLLATLTGAKAQSTIHNFDSVTFIKTPGALSAEATYMPTRPDSIWKMLLIYHDTLSGTVPISGPLDSGMYSGWQTATPPIDPSDSTICWIKIASRTRDTSTHLFVRDTTRWVVMSKLPTENVTCTPTNDSIHYTLVCNGGNNNGVPVLVEFFTDAAETYSYPSHSYTVSGSGTFTFNGSYPATLSPMTTYYLRFTITNPVTGTVVIHQAVTTLNTLTSVVYLTAGPIKDSTSNSVTVSVNANLWGHPAVIKLHRRKSTETSWTYTKLITSLDSTVSGLQTSVDTMTGLAPLTTYVYAYEAINAIDTNWLTGTVTTLDTALYVDTSSTFHVLGVYALDSSMGINTLYHYHGNGTNTLSMLILLKNASGSTMSTQTFPGLSGSGLQYARFIVPDSGNYFVQALIFDDVTGASDETTNTLVHVAASSHSTAGIEEVNAQYNDVECTAMIFAIDGKQMQVLKNVKYGDIKQALLADYTPGIYYAQCISVNGEKLPTKKIPVTHAW